MDTEEGHMQAGMIISLQTPTLGILVENNQRIPVIVPANDVVTVFKSSDGDRMVDVLWYGKTLVMFAVDLCDSERRWPSAQTVCTGEPMSRGDYQMRIAWHRPEGGAPNSRVPHECWSLADALSMVQEAF
jgi:hypothetical protein